MKYTVTQDRLKLRNLKNKTLLRHPNSHLPQPTDNTLPNAAQDAVSLFFAARMHCWLMFNFLSTRTSRWFLAVSSQAIPINSIIPPHTQDLALPFLQLHEVPVSPFLQPFEISYKAVVTPWIHLPWVTAPKTRVKPSINPLQSKLDKLFTSKTSAEGHSKRISFLLPT